MRSLILSVLALTATMTMWSVVGYRIINEAVAGQLTAADEKTEQPAAEAAKAPAADVSVLLDCTGKAALKEDKADGENGKAAEKTAQDEKAPQAKVEKKAAAIKQGRIPAFVTKGVAWLVAAQHNDGGWGGGSHAHQDVRDPQAVVTDPATTAFTLISLLRAGHTPVGGEYKPQVRKGLEYLVTAVEKAPVDGPLITDIEGTQPQTKLGRNVDTAMTAQYLARALKLLPKEDELYPRVDKALDKCLAKLHVSQQKDGSWGEGGGWAPVLQSSLSCSALEIAAASGKKVDKGVLQKAREYQKGNFDSKSGKADAKAAAGVELYAFNGAFRANASEAAQADALIKDAKTRGVLAESAPTSAENLQIAGAQKPEQAQRLAAAAVQNEAQIARLGDDQLLAGFGNNGGEEFLSYLMTSETLAIAGVDKFNQWQDKMQGKLTKIQNTDGSWSGQHCITSPVFCTAAVVQCLTADQDAEFLVAMAKHTTDETAKVAGVTPPSTDN